VEESKGRFQKKNLKRRLQKRGAISKERIAIEGYKKWDERGGCEMNDAKEERYGYKDLKSTRGEIQEMGAERFTRFKLHMQERCAKGGA
jgi:hypothetical protein